MAIIQGSASSEPLLGTINNDTIYGAGGSDTIDGLAGTDTAVISSGRAFFTITNLSGAVRVTENGLAAFPYKYTTVRLLNVEKVQFLDSTETIFSTANKVMLSGYNFFSYQFVGTADNETIDGAGGDDWIDGGAGTDTAVFFGNRSDFKIVNLEGAVRITGFNTAPSDYNGYTAKLINTERVQFADDLAPTNLNLTANKVMLSGYNFFSYQFVGTADNETIDGAGGNDWIDGGAGTDTAVFFGNRSDFKIVNLEGAVRITGLNTAPSDYNGYTAKLINTERVQFLDSVETVTPTINKVMLSGYNFFSYQFVGTADNETIDGAGGNDLIDGGAGTDTAVFFGNRSDFRIVNLEGAVRITGLNTAPSDYNGYTAKLINTERVQFLDSVETVTPTINKVMLSGYNFFSYQFVGTADNETIDGAGGNDWIDGGAGTDTAVFFGNRSDFKIVNLEGAVRITGLNTAPSDYNGYTAKLINTERVQFLDSVETVTPTINKVMLSGYNFFSYQFVGTADNETIDGAGGNDLIDGGAGTDTAVFFGNRSDFRIVNLEGAVRITGLNTAPSDYNGYTAKLINTERVQFLDSVETVTPTINKVMLSGYNFFSYQFVGTADNETIDGAGGNDLIDGGAGTDTAVFFGNRSDFRIVNLEGAVRITGLNTAPSDYNGYTAKLINTERVQFLDSVETVTPTINKVMLSGYNFFSYQFVGTADNETIDGAGGNDLIDGGAGTDTAVFFGNSSDFSVTNLNGVVQVTGLNTAPSEYRGYTAQLTNVENVQFIDLKVSQNGSVNHSPTGSVHINVTNPSAGQTLTAFNDLDDADGVGTITYQWKAGGVNVGVGQNYQVAANDLGKTITVTASYTDGFDYLENVSSAATAAVTSTLLTSAVNGFQLVLSDEEKLIIGSEKVGMIRVMADFSKAAYHLEPNENRLINDVSPNADAAVINPDWQPLNLNIPIADRSFTYIDHEGFNSEETIALLNNGMTNGFYHNGNAAAFVARVNDAIVISFRGTNDNDENDPDDPLDSFNSLDPNNYIYPDADEWGSILDGSGGSMRDHYQLLQPLIGAIDNYVLTNNIGKVYVTGHSLGGAMAIEYMARPEHAGTKYQAITFAAPDFTKNNVDRVSYADDSRIIQIEVSEDPVPQTWDVFIDQNRPGDVIRFAGDQTLNEPDVHPTFFSNDKNHSMDYYRQITDSVDAGSWVRILDDLDKRGDQTVFLGGRRNGDNFFVDEGGDTLTDTDLDQEDINHLGDDNIEIFYGGRGRDTLTGGDTKELLLGGPENDKLYGNGDVDRLFGDAGNDTLDGGSGVDTLIGGLGDDTYVVENASDVITENPGTLAGTKDHVNSYLISYTLPANVENLTLKLPPLGANNNGTGNGLANIITGNALINILNGAAGNDRLLGKGGKDTLTGGAGADKFIFDTATGTNNIDTITDFVTNTDKILLDDDIFTALGITGTAAGVALTAGKFHAGASALDTLDRIIYNPATGALFYDANGSVSGQNVQIALIGTSTHPTLSAADFQVIA